MSVRLFHKHTRIVLRVQTRGRAFVWYALHRRAVAWADIFTPSLLLVGFPAESETDRLSFPGGSVRWTTGALGTTIRLQLPPCSERKGALLASGLLKAARYARVTKQEDKSSGEIPL
jgi:hypothetical protein